MTTLYPLLLQATLHTKVWGGRRLETVMHKSLPTSEPYGESWELYDTSTVANGPLAGRTLGDVLAETGHDLIGPDSDPAEGFPLLAKFLDANEWLSVQVHPNDAQAKQLEGEPRGKNEAWYVLSAEPGARLVLGVRPGTPAAELAQAARRGQLDGLLIYAEVSAGDVLTMDAGTVHALGPGIVVYEIQQASDTTYRLYDWGRMGLDGKPRELHVEKGVAVANTQSLPPIKHTAASTEPLIEIVRTPYFVTLLHRLAKDKVELTTQEGKPRFHALSCIEGEAEVKAAKMSVTMQTGQTVLVPASLGRYTLAGSGRALRSFQP